jgi:excisionase family DNA binding protein
MASAGCYGGFHAIPLNVTGGLYDAAMASVDIRWMSTGEAARRLGVTVRTLYRLIDEGELPAYKFGRVIRLQEHEVDEFITQSRIAPGKLHHLYPDARRELSEAESTLG